MKAKILIITGLAIPLILAFCSKSHAQEGNVSKVIKYDTTFLLADETTLSYYKTEARIHCSNESVFTKIFTTHGTLFKRFTCTWKTDRHGRYKDYIIYLSKGDAETIIKWANKNL